MYGFYLHFYSFVYLFYVLIWILSIFLFLFSSHIQRFIAYAVWGLLRHWAVLWSPPVTCIELDIEGPHFGEWNHSNDSVFCSASSHVCTVDLSAQSRAFPALCWKAGIFYPSFFFSLWTKVICTVIFSLQNLLLALPLQTQLNARNSSVRCLPLLHLDGFPSHTPLLLPWPLHFIPHTFLICCVHMEIRGDGCD